MSRPHIRKTNGQWTTTRPAYGFGKPYTTTHRTWRAALDSLQERPGTSTLQAELSPTPDDGIASIPRWSSA